MEATQAAPDDNKKERRREKEARRHRRAERKIRKAAQRAASAQWDADQSESASRHSVHVDDTRTRPETAGKRNGEHNDRHSANDPQHGIKPAKKVKRKRKRALEQLSVDSGHDAHNTPLELQKREEKKKKKREERERTKEEKSLQEAIIPAHDDGNSVASQSVPTGAEAVSPKRSESLANFAEAEKEKKLKDSKIRKTSTAVNAHLAKSERQVAPTDMNVVPEELQERQIQKRRRKQKEKKNVQNVQNVQVPSSEPPPSSPPAVPFTSTRHHAVPNRQQGSSDAVQVVNGQEDRSGRDQEKKKKKKKKRAKKSEELASAGMTNKEDVTSPDKEGHAQSTKDSSSNVNSMYSTHESDQPPVKHQASLAASGEGVSLQASDVPDANTRKVGENDRKAKGSKSRSPQHATAQWEAASGEPSSASESKAAGGEVGSQAAGGSKAAPRKPSVASMFAAMSKRPTSSRGRGVGEQSGATRHEATSDAKRAPIKSREAVVDDAQTLSHEDMLVDRLYYAEQLRWLEEEFGLKVKTGSFSKWEDDRIKQALEEFMKENDLEEADFARLLDHREDNIQAELYEKLWRHLTRSVPGRPNRSVRIHVRRRYATYGFQGAWTPSEKEKLVEAVRMYGESWPEVSALVQRSQEACRFRWRDHEKHSSMGYTRGNWKPDEEDQLREVMLKACREQGIDASSPLENRLIPWSTAVQMLSAHGVKRSLASCKTQWFRMQAREQDWNKEEDCKMLVQRLSEQSDALARDDFSEVDLKSLTANGWKWPRFFIRNVWQRLLAANVEPNITDIDRGFRNNVEKLQSALAKGELRTVSVRKRDKEKRKTKEESDEIDSSEEL